jgi:hypothetical protein
MSSHHDLAKRFRRRLLLRRAGPGSWIRGGQVNPLRLHVAIVVARSAGPELILIQVKNADQTADSNIYRNQSLRPQIGGDVSILSSS